MEKARHGFIRKTRLAIFMLNIAMMVFAAALCLSSASTSALYFVSTGFALGGAATILCVLTTYLAVKVLVKLSAFATLPSAGGNHPGNISSAGRFLFMTSMGTVVCTLIQASIYIMAEVIGYSRYMESVAFWSTVVLSSDLATILMATLYQFCIMRRRKNPVRRSYLLVTSRSSVPHPKAAGVSQASMMDLLSLQFGKELLHLMNHSSKMQTSVSWRRRLMQLC